MVSSLTCCSRLSILMLTGVPMSASARFARSSSALRMPSKSVCSMIRYTTHLLTSCTKNQPKQYAQMNPICPASRDSMRMPSDTGLKGHTAESKVDTAMANTAAAPSGGPSLRVKKKPSAQRAANKDRKSRRERVSHMAIWIWPYENLARKLSSSPVSSWLARRMLSMVIWAATATPPSQAAMENTTFRFHVSGITDAST
mmetsp:Transcript_26464/g.54174  ORF Transcript_26464/g.54174 Transcript_26464/m.54174 type:complete len:200 (+) Transcript_26464:282-881(+)